MPKDKKMIAAISAVRRYIQQDEEALYARGGVAAPSGAQPQRTSLAAMNLWALNGRQSQMQWRNLMQLKGFGGWKSR